MLQTRVVRRVAVALFGTAALAVAIAIPALAATNPGSAKKGKVIFVTNCVTCHVLKAANGARHDRPEPRPEEARVQADHHARHERQAPDDGVQGHPDADADPGRRCVRLQRHARASDQQVAPRDGRARPARRLDLPVRAAKAARTAFRAAGCRYTGAPWLESASSSRCPSAPRSVRPNPGACASRASFPGVLYGRSEPVAIAVGERELRAALTTPGRQPRRARRRGRQRPRALGDPQGLPARQGARARSRTSTSRRSASTSRSRPRSSVTLVGEPVGRKEGGVLCPGHERGQRRGAAARGPAAPRGRRLRRCRSATRSASSEIEVPDGRHVPRRPRGDRARERHAADRARSRRGRGGRPRARSGEGRGPRPRRPSGGEDAGGEAESDEG